MTPEAPSPARASPWRAWSEDPVGGLATGALPRPVREGRGVQQGALAGSVTPRGACQRTRMCVLRGARLRLARAPSPACRVRLSRAAACATSRPSAPQPACTSVSDAPAVPVLACAACVRDAACAMARRVVADRRVRVLSSLWPRACGAPRGRGRGPQQPPPQRGMRVRVRVRVRQREDTRLERPSSPRGRPASSE